MAALGALATIGTGPAATAEASCYWTTDADGVQKYVCPVQSPGKAPSAPQDPEHAPSDPAYEEALGKLCAELANLGEPLPPACTAGAPDPADPAQLLQQAMKVLNPPFPHPKTAPPRGADAAVGLPVWVWVDAATWKPITKRAVAGAVWAEVTATPIRLVLRPGDGSEEICAGPGVPWSAHGSGAPPCTHRFLQSSAHQPDSAFPMTVTVVWRATWTSSANSNPTPLPDITRDAAFPIRVAEGQALN